MTTDPSLASSHLSSTVTHSPIDLLLAKCWVLEGPKRAIDPVRGGIVESWNIWAKEDGQTLAGFHVQLPFELAQRIVNDHNFVLAHSEALSKQECGPYGRLKKRRGRPRIWASVAERRAAYNSKKKAERIAAGRPRGRPRKAASAANTEL